MYLRYVEEYPTSTLARDYRMTKTATQVDEMVHIFGGHFATALFENRLNDAWIHADFNNEKRMLYLGFRANMPQVYRDCAGIECKITGHDFINDVVAMLAHFDCAINGKSSDSKAFRKVAESHIKSYSDFGDLL
tara:strand:- start:4 stop:405 length:402 start_codon:yes stop_codon:yes gene_type:complete